jgi:hypothetical protein
LTKEVQVLRLWFITTGGLGLTVWAYNLAVYFGVFDPLG